MKYNKEEKISPEDALMDKRIAIALNIHYEHNVPIDRVLKILCKKYNYSYQKVCSRVDKIDLYLWI